jgi:hypothetical protein
MWHGQTHHCAPLVTLDIHSASEVAADQGAMHVIVKLL